MVSRGGRCLYSLLILTGFLFGATNGDTTMGPPTTLVQTIPSVTTAESTTLDPTTPGTTNSTVEGTGPFTEIMTEIVTEIVNSTTVVTSSLATLNVTPTIVVNECETSAPCMNGGTCTDTPDSYTCNCAAEFSGPTCEEVNECDTSPPCMNGGTCTDTTASYTCSCVPGYTGTNCETENVCITNSLCMNGGTCAFTSDPTHYSCSCVPGYTGTNCETDINECDLMGDEHPCDTTNGDCMNNDGSYVCSCNPGYMLDQSFPQSCNDIDECSFTGNAYPCDSDSTRGACMNNDGSYVCSCNPGYMLDQSFPQSCNDIDECLNTTCENGGTCNDLVNGYNCSCPIGYNGTLCENDIDECLSNPCMNGGNCTDLVNEYTCSCLEGFNGTHCEFDIDACDPDPCDNEGNCTNHLMNSGDANFTCLCMPGWTGRNCSEDFRECDSMPCQNGGNCTDGTNYYNCACAPGFNGTYCENICPAGTFGDYCTESCTCVDGANCSNVDGNCTCEPAFDRAVCDRSEVEVTASLTSNDTISKGNNFTLACQVNLAGNDLVEVARYRDNVKLPGTTDEDYRVDNNPDMGMYSITILGADALDTGAYHCTAVTKGNQFNASSENISVDVVVQGNIDRELSKREDYIQLNQTASLNCTVFSSSIASIAWERDGERLEDNVSRTSIEPSQEMGTGGMFFFSVLNISDIVREDNGTYICLALDGAGNVTDRADFNIFVQEVAELANPRYLNVRSNQLQLVWDFTVQGNDDNINCIAKYWIQGTTNETEQDVGGTSPGLVTELEPYTGYEFQLLCVNLAGSSKTLDFGSTQTLAGKPSQPKNVWISDIEARRVFVEWVEPEVKNGPIDGYTLTATGGNEDVNETTLGSGTSTVHDKLTPYTTYTISIRAHNNNIPEGRQFSDESSPSLPFTTSQAAPGKPAGLAVDDTPTACTISWETPSVPNGVITKYSLYTEIVRRDTNAVDKAYRMDLNADENQKTFIKAAELEPYSIFRYSVTASTAPGEGDNATTTDTCETPQGVPVAPQPIPTPSVISQTSFTTTLQPYDARNGPISCCEVIVVELQSVDAGLNLDPSGPSYLPDQIKSYEEAQNTKGTPYSAVVFSNCPANGIVVIGATTGNVSTCHTGGLAGSANRRRRETTRASTLSAVNGPLNPSGIYSTFVRVYTPSEDSEMAFYESGPFMAPVTLKPKPPNVAGIVGGLFGIVIIVGLVIVVMILYRRKKDYANDPLMTPTSNGPRENGNGTIIGLQNLGIDDEHDIVVKPIQLENLEKTIRQKAQEEKRIFWAEYKALPNRPPPLATMNHSNLPPNKDKNRYINIIAYDHTRVKLKPTDGVEGSDYINASYVNGYQSPDKFIAAQGPKDNTLEDFWRMIWEYDCSTIVMLTKCIEDGKDKCSQYWPNKGVIKYGRFKVKMDSVNETAEYVIRSFLLSEDGKETGERSITQFHFLGWPDHGQPDYPSPMMCLIKRVRHLTSKMNHRANIVVHCSAGVGRTGTYIVIDAMLDMMKHEKQVDVYNFIHDIRQQRNTLVQSFVQYFFIHMALLEEYLFGHSDVAMSDFPAYYQQLSNKSDFDDDLTKLEVEFRRACKLGVNGTDQTFANIDQNKDKNRIGHILPYDKNVVKLERLIGEEFSDYINASYITGYQRKNMYIATQGPLPNTIADFWRMIWESQTSTIVMLTEISQKGHEMCAQYWPLEINETEEQGDISVTLVEESDEDEDFTIRDIEISHAHMMQNIYGNTDATGEASAEGDDTESDPQTALYGNVESPPPTPMKDIRKIRQFHFRGWPEVGVPESGIDLMRLVNKSHLHQKEKGPKPIVVHCSAGSGRTGVFIALNVLMSRMEEESMIDVFQTVRGLRQQRPHMVQDLAQFKFCYSAMVEYLEEQGTEYQNFVPRV